MNTKTPENSMGNGRFWAVLWHGRAYLTYMVLVCARMHHAVQ